MANPVDAQAGAVIVAVVAAAAWGVGFGVSSWTAPPMPVCAWGFEGNDYCVQSLTISGWCPAGYPCPFDGNSTTVLGYTFLVVGVMAENGTYWLSVSIRGAPGEGYGYGFQLFGDPYGVPVGWVSPDGRLMVSWPDPIPSWENGAQLNSTVICGAAY